VGAAHDAAGHHLVARCYLVLDEYTGVGESRIVLSDRLDEAFAAGLFIGKHFSVVDEVGASIFSTASTYPMTRASKKRWTRSLFFSSTSDTGVSSLPTRVLY
jgi:hypothetical protein